MRDGRRRANEEEGGRRGGRKEIGMEEDGDSMLHANSHIRAVSGGFCGTVIALDCWSTGQSIDPAPGA